MFTLPSTISFILQISNNSTRAINRGRFLFTFLHPSSNEGNEGVSSPWQPTKD
jgi:hypothetical protein